MFFRCDSKSLVTTYHARQFLIRHRHSPISFNSLVTLSLLLVYNGAHMFYPCHDPYRFRSVWLEDDCKIRRILSLYSPWLAPRYMVSWDERYRSRSLSFVFALLAFGIGVHINSWYGSDGSGLLYLGYQSIGF